jgi:hypothetical protein
MTIEPNRLFKASDYLGMCDPDMETHYELYDRVISVRLGTGVPMGTRGTIIGIMLGQTHLDTYYEVLFDHLQKNSLDAILLGGNNQLCRIKVRSYHLLNYSHSLRARSMSNNQQQRVTSTDNAWDRRLTDQPASARQAAPQQPTRILRRTSNETNSNSNAKSKQETIVPVTTTQEKPLLMDSILSSAKEQSGNAKMSASLLTDMSKLTQPVTENALLSQSVQNPVLAAPLSNEKRSTSQVASPTTNTVTTSTSTSMVDKTIVPSQVPSSASSSTDSLLMRAINDSRQLPTTEMHLIHNPPASILQQSWNNMSHSSALPSAMDLSTSDQQQSWKNIIEQAASSQSHPIDSFTTQQQQQAWASSSSTSQFQPPRTFV